MPIKSICTGKLRNECEKIVGCKWWDNYNMCYRDTATKQQVHRAKNQKILRQNSDYVKRENAQKLKRYHELSQNPIFMEKRRTNDKFLYKRERIEELTLGLNDLEKKLVLAQENESRFTNLINEYKSKFQNLTSIYQRPEEHQIILTQLNQDLTSKIKQLEEQALQNNYESIETLVNKIQKQKSKIQKLTEEYIELGKKLDELNVDMGNDMSNDMSNDMGNDMDNDMDNDMGNDSDDTISIDNGQVNYLPKNMEVANSFVNTGNNAHSNYSQQEEEVAMTLADLVNNTHDQLEQEPLVDISNTDIGNDPYGYRRIFNNNNKHQEEKIGYPQELETASSFVNAENNDYYYSQPLIDSLAEMEIPLTKKQQDHLSNFMKQINFSEPRKIKKYRVSKSKSKSKLKSKLKKSIVHKISRTKKTIK